MSTSVRQQIVACWASTLRATGQFARVMDAEPFDYERAPLPSAWVIEGDESIDHGSFFGKAQCDLTLVVQVLFKFDSSNVGQSLYELGRAHLAALQQVVMANLQWNGLAVLTLEQGNSIGRLDTEARSLGVLTTEWVVRYRRNTFDPAQR